MKTISVIIPCFNCAPTIERCVETLLAGTQRPMEIIAVDDRSTDATAHLLRRLAGKHPGILRIVTTPLNAGPAMARNVGAATARGNYLFFVDSDTEALPDTLANFSRRIADYDAVVGNYDAEPLNNGASARYKALLYDYLLGGVEPRPYDLFSASCAGIRAEVFRALGGYYLHFPRGLDFENEEFGYRISNSYRMALDGTVRVRHHFPGLGKMSRAFFQRTALWVEMFTMRKRFSTAATTGTTGVSSMALLGALLCLPAGFTYPFGYLLPLALFAVYLYGYCGFFVYLARNRPRFLAAGIALNLYYTTVIACGALTGLARVALRRSRLIRDIVHPDG